MNVAELEEMSERVARAALKGQDYAIGVTSFQHAQAVATRVTEMAKALQLSAQTISLLTTICNLHDVIEDGVVGGNPVDVTYLLGKGFPPVVAYCVRTLSHISPGGHGELRPSREEYREQVALPTNAIFRGVSERDRQLQLEPLRRDRLLQVIKPAVLLCKCADMKENTDPVRKAELRDADIEACVQALKQQQDGASSGLTEDKLYLLAVSAYENKLVKRLGKYHDDCLALETVQCAVHESFAGFTEIRRSLEKWPVIGSQLQTLRADGNRLELAG